MRIRERITVDWHCKSEPNQVEFLTQFLSSPLNTVVLQSFTSPSTSPDVWTRNTSIQNVKICRVYTFGGNQTLLWIQTRDPQHPHLSKHTP